MGASSRRTLRFVKRTILLSLVLTLGLSAPSQAGWRIDRAEQIAAIVWHNPCGGHIPIQWDPAPSDMDPFADGWVDPGVCVIHLSTTAAPRQWEDVCDVILHETGHLAGFRDPANIADPDHSLNEHSVMYGGPFREDDVRCAQRGRPFLQAHGQQSSPTISTKSCVAWCCKFMRSRTINPTRASPAARASAAPARSPRSRDALATA